MLVYFRLFILGGLVSLLHPRGTSPFILGYFLGQFDLLFKASHFLGLKDPVQCVHIHLKISTNVSGDIRKFWLAKQKHRVLVPYSYNLLNPSHVGSPSSSCFRLYRS